MSNVAETAVEPGMLASIKGCAAEGVKVLKLKDAKDPKALVEAVDAFVYRWQKGERPDAKILDEEDAPLIMASLWGEQLVQRFGWSWAMVTSTDEDGEEYTSLAVLSKDRSLVVYPLDFVSACLEEPRIDCTIALSFNMLDAKTIKGPKPREYVNLMLGVHRIVPRD